MAASLGLAMAIASLANHPLAASQSGTDLTVPSFGSIETILPSRPARPKRRRAQGRSRTAVALSAPHAHKLPGRALTAPSTGAGWSVSGHEVADGRAPPHFPVPLPAYSTAHGKR